MALAAWRLLCCMPEIMSLISWVAPWCASAACALRRPPRQNPALLASAGGFDGRRSRPRRLVLFGDVVNPTHNGGNLLGLLAGVPRVLAAPDNVLATSPTCSMALVHRLLAVAGALGGLRAQGVRLRVS